MRNLATAAAPAPALSTAPILKVAGLNAWYGESHVLHGVDFEIGAGEVVTLLGRDPFSIWIQVRRADGTVGWVSGRYLTSNVPYSTLPVINAN